MKKKKQRNSSIKKTKLKNNRASSVSLTGSVTSSARKYKSTAQFTDEHVRLVSEITSDFIFSVIINPDNSKTLEWITKGFKKETGFQFQNLLKPNTWKKYFHSDDHSVITNVSKSIYANKKVTAQFRLIKKEGVVTWFHGTFNPVYDKKLKRVIKYYGAVKDITEQKKTEIELVELNNQLEERIEEKTSQLENAVANLKHEVSIRAAAENQARESNKIIRETAKSLDKKLRDSEYKHLWNVFEYSEIPTVTIAQNGLCLNYNKAAEKLFGYTHQEMPNIESWLNKLIHREFYKNIVRRVTYKSLSDHQKSYNFEARITNKFGVEKHLVLQINSLFHEGSPVGIQICQFTDITEKKLAEQELNKTIEKYKALFSAFPIGISISDNKGKIIESNKAAEEIFGISTSEHNSRNIDSPSWKVIRPDGSVMPTSEYCSVIALNEGITASNIAMGVYKSEKDVAWISVKAAPLPIAAGGGIVAAYSDISQNIANEKSLQESEERYRKLVDSSPFPLFVHKNGIVLFANDACLKMFRAEDSSQIIGKNLFDYVHNDYKYIAGIKLRTLNQSPQDHSNFELKFYLYDKQLIDVEAKAIPIVFNSEPAVLVVANDVTEKNNALSKLRETEFQLKFLIEKSPIVVFKIDKNGVFTLSEGNGLAKLGLKPGEAVGLSVFELYKNYPDIILAVNKALNGTESREFLNIEDTIFDIYYTPLFDKNENVESVGGIAYDITEQREYENELLKSAKQWQITFDSVTDAVFIVDLNSVIVKANKTSEKILGKPIDQIIGMHCFELVHGTSKPHAECPVQRMKITRQRETMIYQSGEKWYYVTADPIFDDAGKLTAAVHSISDITERHIIQEKLEKSEALYRLISENTADVIWILDLKTTTFVYVSQSVYKLSGYTPEEIYKLSLEDMFTKESYAKAVDKLKKNLEIISSQKTDLENITDEFNQVHKDGRIVPIEVSTTLLFNDEGLPVSLLGVTRDLTDRKEAHKKLAESEARYRKIVEISPEAIFVHHENKFLFANRSALELFAVSSLEELNAKNFYDYFHPDSYELVKERKEIISSGKAEQLLPAELKIINASGILVYIESIATALEFNGIRAIQSVVRNITQRKENERALKESQDRFRQVVEYSPSAILIHQNRKIVYANPAAVHLLRAITLEELHNRNIMDFIHADCQDLVTERIWASANTMQPLPPTEERIIRLDGKELEVELVSVPFYLNNSLAFQLIIRDITEEKAKTERLRKLSHAVEQNIASVIITDCNGIIEYANPRASELTGYSLTEILGQTPSLFNSGLQSKDFYKRLWSTILAGNEWRGEFQNKKKNGEIFWEFATISPIKNEAGKITHFVSIKDDITERKKFDDEMLIVKDEAEHAYKVKNSLLANMSHELRTPLNGIIGFSQLLKDYVGDQDAQMMLDKIIKSGQRLSSTFTEILSLSELEMGDVEIKNSQVDLALFCQEMKLLFVDRAEAKNLSLEVDLSTETLNTYSDEGWLARITTHLIDNAIKFTNKGSITIHLNSSVIKNEIEYAVINIIDTGIGIKEEAQSSLFKEFRQVSEGTRRDFEGLGLGLSLAKRMAMNLSCLVTFESEFGKGSTFSIWIPLLIEIPAEKLFPEQAILNDTTKDRAKELQILLVEDNPLNIDVVEKFLSKTGSVTPVRNGEAAVKAAKSSMFDLLLVDISLGHGIDGIEVLKQIRLLENYTNVPAIALTGYVSETNKRRFQAAGFNGFLGKPFEKKDLLNYISKIFSA
ncbi:MAG: NarL family signal transduction histidine kinase [Ignavibacteria bacterium]|nr:MAG: NarL family signal transduction histidine kinase [Ignavibacteria bacterium]KAF0160729.1 MAG: NarL family signal transduction histidine kinase [Ignavibacteria bacterium]